MNGAEPSLAEPCSPGSAASRALLLLHPLVQPRVLRGREGAADKSGKALWVLGGNCPLKIRGLLK